MRSKTLILLVFILLSSRTNVDSKSNINYYLYPKDIIPKYKEIHVYINNEKINFDKKPHIIKGHTMVQLRPIYENYGLKLTWNGKNKTITGVKDSINISLSIGDNIIKVNGKKVFSKIEPYIVDGHTMIPLRLISENIGAKVNYDDQNKIININY